MEKFIQTDYLPLGYLINEKGNIKSPKGKILKTSLSNSGYRCLNIKNKGHFIHRAICFAFIDKVVGKDFVNHKNGIKTDNRIENLEWCTKSENLIHAYKTNLKTYMPLHYKGKYGSDHNRSQRVICLESGIVYESQSEAQRELKLGGGSVSWSIKYKRPVKGMHFEKAN